MKVGNVRVRWHYLGLETHCCIYDTATKENVSVGVVKRYYKDPANKELARKKSLTAALRNFSRESRKPFWDAYRILSPSKPKWIMKITIERA